MYKESPKLNSFVVPKELIAQTPASPRDHARLLVYNRRTNEIFDDYFYNLNSYLPQESSLVLNSTRVANSRLLFLDGKIEIFILKVKSEFIVEALVRPGKKFKLGDIIDLDEGIKAEVLLVLEDGSREIKFNKPVGSAEVQAFAHVPLPPYIEQNDQLADEYQTVYASGKDESAAAPTAGLHFTDSLLKEVGEDHQLLKVDLSVGLGTFASIDEDNFKEEKLHTEEYFISEEAAKEIEEAKHITAVGTTSVRTLESATDKPGGVKSGAGSTDIFITPGYKFKQVNSLITNFHLPGTSLLYLVAAFLKSEDELVRIYEHAIENGYRFFSFGDAMLIL